MKRIIRGRPLTRKEAARYKDIRQKISSATHRTQAVAIAVRRGIIQV